MNERTVVKPSKWMPTRKGWQAMGLGALWTAFIVYHMVSARHVPDAKQLFLLTVVWAIPSAVLFIWRDWPDLKEGIKNELWVLAIPMVFAPSAVLALESVLVTALKDYR